MGTIFKVGDFTFVVIIWAIVIALVVMFVHFCRKVYKIFIGKTRK